MIAKCKVTKRSFEHKQFGLSLRTQWLIVIVSSGAGWVELVSPPGIFYLRYVRFRTITTFFI
jgi:hypothetical protein